MLIRVNINHNDIFLNFQDCFPHQTIVERFCCEIAVMHYYDSHVGGMDKWRVKVTFRAGFVAGSNLHVRIVSQVHFRAHGALSILLLGV
jgi:hypothetical protein